MAVVTLMYQGWPRKQKVESRSLSTGPPWPGLNALKYISID